MRRAGSVRATRRVETDAQKSFLQSIGCDELQGFFMARPMPSAEIDKLFKGVRRVTSPKRDTPPRRRNAA